MPLRTLAIGAILLILTACGQKGPLRLPDESPTQDNSTESTANQESREP
ncbi:MAG TPA: hypothetical protein DIW43_01580 [Spongiibacteraceae bacterium]|nr:hypothetical protein [Spongiibacteraceae bacterium]HCS26112.1 hypothetical protein [Spongiibacteraceae bacterium]